MRALRCFLTAACCSILGGCVLYEAIQFGESTPAAKMAGAGALDSPPILRLYSYALDVQLTACEQSEEVLGYTLRCDYVFPDGTRIRSVFEFDRLGGNAIVHRHAPLVLQVPAGAAYFRGTFDNLRGSSGALAITSGLSSLPIDTTTTMRAEPGQELVIVDFPSPPAVPDRMQLRFSYRAATPDIKVVSTAKFELGSRTFYPPLLPCVSTLAGVAPMMANAIPAGAAVAMTAQPCNAKVYDFLGSGDPGPDPVTVVEFYNESLDHYFITAAPAEIAALDAGTTLRGWSRTGGVFNLYRSAGAGTSPICRYYLPPAFGDSHFFGRGLDECRATGDRNPSFVLEHPEIMHAWLPTQGVCPANTRAIYRVFSNRPDANHRYTTLRAIRDSMVARGWVAEGDGDDRVVMCGPV